MTRFNKTIGKLTLLSLLPMAMAGCDHPEPISFSRNVRPILDQYCMDCHRAGGEGELASEFNMETYAGVMKGTRFGSMIIAGDAQSSNMVVLMEGRADPSINMPHGTEKPIPDRDIQIIRSWINQGAENN